MSTISVFQEVAAVLHWLPGRSIGMLWAYFDESGSHDKNGRMIRLALAGCIANKEAWDRFEIEWGLILKCHKVPYFHAIDFETKKPPKYSPYYGWNKQDRLLFIDLLLDTMIRNVPQVFSISETIDGKVKTVRDLYSSCASVVVKMLGYQMPRQHNDNISFMFAQHPEIENEAIGAFCDKLKLALPNIELCMMGNPQTMLPLQAADLFAYEVKQCEKWNNVAALRYQLRRLRSSKMSFWVWPQR